MTINLTYEIQIDGADSVEDAVARAVSLMKDKNAVMTFDYQYESETIPGRVHGGRVDYEPSGVISITDSWYAEPAAN